MWSVEDAIDYVFDAGLQGTDPVPIASTDFVVYNGARASSDVSVSEIEKFFDAFSDDPDVMGAQGIVNLCAAANVEPEDPAVLAFSFALKAAHILQFTKSEFVKGCVSLRVHNAQELASLVPDLRRIVAERPTTDATYKALYAWTYNWALPEGQKKGLEVQTGIALWRVLFTPKKFPLLEEYLVFLEKNHPRAISKDEWNLTRQFAPLSADVSKIEDDGAWPVVVDDFVASRKK